MWGLLEVSTHQHAPEGRAGVGLVSALVFAAVCSTAGDARAAEAERPLPITLEALREGSGANDGRALAMRAIEHLRANDLARAETELVLAGARAPGAAETWAARELLLAKQTPWDLPERLETYRAMWGALAADPAASLSLQSFGYRLGGDLLTILGAALSFGLAAAAAGCFHVDLRRAAAHLVRAVVPRPLPWLTVACAALVTGSLSVGMAGLASIGVLYLQGWRRLLIPATALCIAFAPLLTERADRLDNLVSTDELYALRTISQRCSSSACRDALRLAATTDPSGASGVALARALRSSSNPEDQSEAARLLANPARLASLQRFASGEALGSTPAGLTATWLSEAGARAAAAPRSGNSARPGLGEMISRLGGWLLAALVLQAGLLAVFLRRDGLLSSRCITCGAVCSGAEQRPGGGCNLCATDSAGLQDAEQQAAARHRPNEQIVRAAWLKAIGDLLLPGLGGLASSISVASLFLLLLSCSAVALLAAPEPWWPTTAAAVGILRGVAALVLGLLSCGMLVRLIRLVRTPAPVEER